MTVLSTLRHLYPWWQAMMARVPLAADFCWTCTKYWSEVHGCSLDDVDWDAADRFQVCGGCHVLRFCSCRCQAQSWGEGNFGKQLCILNAALIGPSLRRQLAHRRTQWGAQRSRFIPMLTAIHDCWGLSVKWAAIPDDAHDDVVWLVTHQHIL